jgi:hypothetical protein
MPYSDSLNERWRHTISCKGMSQKGVTAAWRRLTILCQFYEPVPYFLPADPANTLQQRHLEGWQGRCGQVCAVGMMGKGRGSLISVHKTPPSAIFSRRPGAMSLQGKSRAGFIEFGAITAGGTTCTGLPALSCTANAGQPFGVTRGFGVSLVALLVRQSWAGGHRGGRSCNHGALTHRTDV